MAGIKLPKNITILLSIVASQAEFVYSFGYDISIMLLTATTTMKEDLKLTNNQLKHFVYDAKSILFLACVLSGFIADFVGRRPTLIVSGYISCLGFVLMASSHSYGLLIAGRLISLVGMGLGFPITYLYIGEIASPHHRGFLNTIPEWRKMVGAGIFPSLALALGLSYMPESPCWLIMRGRVKDAKAALRMTLKTDSEVRGRLSALRSAARVPATTADTVETVAVPPNAHLLSIWREVILPRSLTTTLAKAIMSILTLHLIQQSTGIDIMTTEAMEKFLVQLPSSAASLKFISSLAPVLCGRLLPTFLPLFLSDISKRDTFFVYSFIFTIISMVIVNISHAVGTYKWWVVVYFGSFSLGFGPITWIHTSEMLPYNVRAQVIGIVAMLNRLLSFGLSYFKPLIDHMTVKDFPPSPIPNPTPTKICTSLPKSIISRSTISNSPSPLLDLTQIYGFRFQSDHIHRRHRGLVAATTAAGVVQSSPSESSACSSSSRSDQNRARSTWRLDP
ncbi:Polyol transporter 5 [Linum grandiflorum]